MIKIEQLLTQGEKSGRYLTKFQRQLLEQQLTVETMPEYRQRIEILLLADDGLTQTQICRALGCSPLTARHWMLMAQCGRGHDWQTQPIGRPKKIDSQYLDRLKELVSKDPREFGYSFPRWTGQWLSKHLSQEFKIEIGARHINRLLKSIDLEDSSTDDLTHQMDRSTSLKITDLHDRRHAS